MTSGQSSWPAFDSAFLAGIAESLRRRSKAIKHRTSGSSCERVIEKTDGADKELMELRFALYGRPLVRMTLCLWGDRWLWIDIRQAARKGWRFEWQHEGRVGATEPRRVVETILATLSQPLVEESARDLARLDALWRAVALQGPRAVPNAI